MFCWEHYLDWDQKRWAEGEAAWTGGRLYYSRGLRSPHLPFQVHSRCFGKIDLHPKKKKTRIFFRQWICQFCTEQKSRPTILADYLGVTYAWAHLKFFSKLPRILRLWDCVSNLRPILNNHIITDLVLFLLFHPFPGFKFVFLSLTTFKLMCIGSPLPAMNLAGNCWQSWKGCLCHFDDRPAMCVHTAQLCARMCAHLKSSFLQVYWAPVLLSVQITGLAKRWRVGRAGDYHFVIIAIHRMESLLQLLKTFRKLLWLLTLVSRLRIAASK